MQTANNVIPTDSLQNGLNVAKGLFSSTWSKARKSIHELNESEAMSKVREASKPLVGAVVDGSKIVGMKLQEGAAAVQPQLQEAGRRVSNVVQDVAEKTRPALEKAGETIKATTTHIVEESKPVVKKVGFVNNGGGFGVMRDAFKWWWWCAHLSSILTKLGRDVHQ